MKLVNAGLSLVGLLVVAYFVLPRLYAYLGAALPFLLVLAALFLVAKVVFRGSGHGHG